MVDAGSRLPFEAVKRLWSWAVSKPMPTFKQTRMRFVIVPERLDENQELYPLHELGRGQVGETGFHMLKDGDRVAIATSPGTHKHGGLNFT